MSPRLRRWRGRRDVSNCCRAVGFSAKTSRSPTLRAFGGSEAAPLREDCAGKARKGADSDWVAQNCHHTLCWARHRSRAISGPSLSIQRAGMGRSGVAGKLCSRLAAPISCSTPSARGRLQRLSRRDGNTSSTNTVARVMGKGKGRREGPGPVGPFSGKRHWAHRSGTCRRWIAARLRCGGLGRRRAARAMGIGTVAAAQERAAGLRRRRRSRHSTVER